MLGESDVTFADRAITLSKAIAICVFGFGGAAVAFVIIFGLTIDHLSK